MDNIRTLEQKLTMVNEEEGTISFRVIKSNLKNRNIELLKIFDVFTGESRFALHRNKNCELIFTHWNINSGERIAILSIEDFSLEKGLLITLTWSKTENFLYVGDLNNKLKLKKSKAEQKNVRIRKSKDGTLYKIGDDNIKVGDYRIKKGSQDILIPTAKEIWDFNIIKINRLINTSKSKDFLHETTLVQQCIVMLITGFEVYTRSRILEIEQEGVYSNNNDLINAFAKKESIKKEVFEYAKINNRSILESLLRIRNGIGLINFQNWKECKKAYNKAYKIKIGEIKNFKVKDPFKEIKDTIELRHKIIHSNKDITIANIDKLPIEKPVFTNREYIIRKRDIFINLIEKLHKKTINLK